MSTKKEVNNTIERVRVQIVEALERGQSEICANCLKVVRRAIGEK